MLNINASANTQMITTAASQTNGTAAEKSNFSTALTCLRNTPDQRNTVGQTNPVTINITNKDDGLLVCATPEYHGHLSSADNFQNTDQNLLALERARQSSIKLYMHTTAEENLPLIHTTGLIAGKKSPPVAGIGDADLGKPCTEGVYVVMPKSSIGADAREGIVGIASSRSPTRDVNYPAGKAGVFLTDKISPLREAAITVVITPSESDQRPSTLPAQCYSFVPEKISPQTKAGAAAFYAQHGINLSPNSATKILVRELKENYPIHTLGIPLPRSPKGAEIEHQQSYSSLSNEHTHHDADQSNGGVVNHLLFDNENL